MKETLDLLFTKHFKDCECNFYSDENGMIYIPRREIGKALGYKNENISMSTIHQKNESFFDNNSIFADVGLGKRGVICYNQKAAIEVCNYSNMPISRVFKSWISDIFKSYHMGEETEMEIEFENECSLLFKEVFNQMETALNTFAGINKTLSSIEQRLTDLENGESIRELGIKTTDCIDKCKMTSRTKKEPHIIKVLELYEDSKKFYIDAVDDFLKKNNISKNKKGNKTELNRMLFVGC